MIYQRHISSNEKDIKGSKSKAIALTGINWEESLGDILIMLSRSPLSRVLQLTQDNITGYKQLLDE